MVDTFIPTSGVDVRNLSDKVLLEQCERFGREALVLRNKFRALLPEVERRKLWKKKGYGSVFEFGKRLAGLSDAQVSESLNIAVRLEDKPMLRGLLESGEVSVNKLRRVMPIMTCENEGELAEKVQVLSSRALEVFAREVPREASALDHRHVPKSECNSLFAQEHELGFNEEVEQRLKELKAKGIDINEALMEFLDKREEKIIQAKVEVTESLPEESSRYIPVRVRKIIEQEYGTKCAKTGCTRPSQELHHTARFALTKSHDPNLLAPLCGEHHQIAHAIDIKVQEMKRR